MKKGAFYQLLDEIGRGKESSFKRVFYVHNHLDTLKVANYLSKLYAVKGITIPARVIWAPFGYRKIGEGKKRTLEIVDDDLMSLNFSQIKFIKENAESAIDQELAKNKKTAAEKKSQLDQLQDKLMAVEEKWIHDQISKDTYDRWTGNYNSDIVTLQAEIGKLTKDHSPVLSILNKHLHVLTDLRSVFTQADTLQKREFTAQGFDSNLYYENGVYRTPTMIEILSHNRLKMKEKVLLIYKKKGAKSLWWRYWEPCRTANTLAFIF